MRRTQAGRPASGAGTAAARQLDFLLGEWDLVWGDGLTGTSSIYADLDGRVLVESFDGRPSVELQAVSIAGYDEGEGIWRLARADNFGAFQTFAGTFTEGTLELRTVGEPLLRIRWFDIADDSMLWSFERSYDAGMTWSQETEIWYRRVL